MLNHSAIDFSETKLVFFPEVFCFLLGLNVPLRPGIPSRVHYFFAIMSKLRGDGQASFIGLILFCSNAGWRWQLSSSLTFPYRNLFCALASEMVTKETAGLEYGLKNLAVSNENKMEDMGTGLTGWQDLPMELLLRIVSITDDRTAIVASGVCTGWRDAISVGLTRLSLSWCSKNMSRLLMSLSPKFRSLQVLCLRQNKPQLQDHAIEALANCCHDLCDLDLSKSLTLTDRSLYALAHGCPHLIKLNISGCSSFSDTALAYLMSFCRGLKRLNLCGCVKAASDRALQAIAQNCKQMQSLNLGWCEDISDKGVTSLALGCPELRALDLCGCVLITDESVVALAKGCLHLRSLGLYFCQNITDRAMYSLVNRTKSGRHSLWGSAASCHDDEGLSNLNISQCTALTAPAVQAVCNSFPALHTCPEKHSLIISGCLSLTSVHCACAFHARRPGITYLSNHAY